MLHKKMDETLAAATTRTANRTDWICLTIAVAMTLGVLIYAWGRTIIVAMMVGRPEPRYAALLALSIAIVPLLTRGLGRRIELHRYGRYVLPGVFGLWIAVNFILIWVATGTQLPGWITALLWTPGTLWVLWISWMFYRPWSSLVRCGVLAALVPLAAVFPLVTKIAGMTGDARPNFTWRRGVFAHAERAAAPSASATPSIAIDLTQTTPHDFPQFHGPNRNATITGGVPLSDDWKAHPPQLLWKKPVGAGWGSFAVVGDYAVTQEQRGDYECVVCYRVSDGAEMWVNSREASFHSSMGGSGPRATPTIVDGLVYTVGGTGLFDCLDGSTGRPLWSVDILKDNGGRPIEHGVCASPLVFGDRVIVCPTGNPAAMLAAYDRESGKRLWQTGKQPASYGSPLLVELVGTPQIVLLASQGVASHDAATGQFLWSFPFTTEYNQNTSQPVIVDGSEGRILLSAGYNVGSRLIEARRAVTGAWSAHEVWHSREMKTKFTSAVLKDGMAYGLDEGILECIDAETGKRKWKGGRYQHGQVLLVDDLLIVQAEDGNVALVRADPKKFMELGLTPALSGKTWNNPALAGRYLLVRNDHEAACFELPVRDE